MQASIVRIWSASPELLSIELEQLAVVYQPNPNS